MLRSKTCKRTRTIQRGRTHKPPTIMAKPDKNPGRRNSKCQIKSLVKQNTKARKKRNNLQNNPGQTPGFFFMKKITLQIKELLTTWQGWIAWGIANVITSIHWAVPALFAVILQDSKLYALSGTLWAIGMTPFIPLWLFNIFIAIYIKNLLMKKEGPSPSKGRTRKGEQTNR
jgi:hypothetical protein